MGESTTTTTRKWMWRRRSSSTTMMDKEEGSWACGGGGGTMTATTRAGEWGGREIDGETVGTIQRDREHRHQRRGMRGNFALHRRD